MTRPPHPVLVHDFVRGLTGGGVMPERPAARVLVVDDDPDIRAVVTLALEEAGYDVREAANGCQALVSLREWRADVILLDLNMPVSNAWQFRDHQRNDPNLTTIPIVVMSASHDLTTIGDELGQQAMLPKPFDLDQLYSVVEGCCSARVN
jgi:CheY-like chemotaxis protein